MKKLIFILLALPIFCAAQYKPPTPFAGTDVHDYINLLTQEQKANLDTIISGIRRKSSTEVAVVILKDLQDHDIADVGLEIGRTWGVGKKGVNNGVVYILCPSLHKGRIEVGNGLEGDLTDITTSRIQDKVKHYYKAEHYYEGILEVVQALDTQLTPVSPEILAKQKEEQRIQDEKIAGIFKDFFIWLLSIGSVVVLFIFGRKYQKKRELKKQEEEAKKARAARERLEAENYRLKVAASVEQKKITIVKDVNSIINSLIGLKDTFALYQIDIYNDLQSMYSKKVELVKLLDTIPEDWRTQDVIYLSGIHGSLGDYLSWYLNKAKVLKKHLDDAKKMEAKIKDLTETLNRHKNGTLNFFDSIVKEIEAKKEQYLKYGIEVNWIGLEAQRKQIVDLIAKNSPPPPDGKRYADNAADSLVVKYLEDNVASFEQHNLAVQNFQKKLDDFLATAIQREKGFAENIQKIDLLQQKAKSELQFYPNKEKFKNLEAEHEKLKSIKRDDYYAHYLILIALIAEYEEIIGHRAKVKKEEEERIQKQKREEERRRQEEEDNQRRERERIIRQQQEDEERRRRNSSSSYGGSSYYGGSSSSNSDSGSYGGGSFSGGGSSSEW